jgi:HSP20 family molecular chaperone IbpA
MSRLGFQPQQGRRFLNSIRVMHLFRAIKLPKKIDPDKVKAELKNGMLYLTADIAAEAPAKKISIQAA